MNFSELYLNNKRDVEKKIATLWGGEANTESQRAQVEKLKEQIGNIFAPEEAVPVVQCMNSYKSVDKKDADKAKAVVGSLWESDFNPYVHQYDSWHTLLETPYKDPETQEEKPMSICVTTGTGSGKTECFMMPLVYDLAKNYQSGQIQAIFLYPLNALMEDQKERLEKMLDNIEKATNVKLTYTVYNGDLPDSVPSAHDHSDEAERTRRKIQMIRGLITDSQGRPLDKNGMPTTDPKEYTYKYPRMVYTRDAVRRKNAAPNILLTNPTMLEYILLRKSDENLIDPTKKSLSWVAIDETHTYTGAGAAELAMLLRRVMLAFGMNAKDVHFATSSATFANTADIEDKKLREQKEKQARLDLQTFISDLTGTSIPQVKVIEGVREGEELLTDTCPLPETDKAAWKVICKADYVELDKLFPEGTIAEKLRQLDEMCKRIEDLYAQDVEKYGKKEAKILMKCKVHYFYRVPNNGMYVRLDEFQNGAFNVYTQKPIEQEEGKLPLLELCRCKHCGEFLAVGMLEKPDGKLYPMESNDTDMFDLGADDDEDADIKQTVFALSNTGVTDDDHTGSYDIEGLLVKPSTNKTYRPTEWHLIGNEYRECPCCRKKLSNYVSVKDKKKEESDAEEIIEDMRLIKLRLSSEFISRVLAPTTLDQLDEATSANSITLHSGQQFLSFVDSRQAAAKATMNQNLEQERLWFYTTIYHELCRLNNGLNLEDVKKKLEDISVDRSVSRAERSEANNLLDELEDTSTKPARIQEIIKQVSGASDAILSWDKIADLLLRDDKFMVFCHQFIKRTEDSEDIDWEGNIKEEAKLKYLYSIMVVYLGNRPATAASHETMGLFRSYYTFLDDLKKPASVDALN
ncbi:MAG: DEAD/DEAH box helicase, partial [Bacteroidaceae bacterium]|nr:DEAD/DEAH box helicase [Bacteroidaceae bacterium]